MSDFEIEVKVKADNVDSLEKLLASKAEFTGEGYQKDDYFTPANRNFLDKEPVEEWLRLGDFIEVEYKRHATKEHSAKIVADMIEFLKSAGCTNIRRSYSGYPYAMLHPNEQEFEAV
jgi:adenylate cyclase class IV